MPVYEASIRSVAAATGAGYATIGAPSTRMRIEEIGISTIAATASSVGLGRPANTPVDTSTVLGQAVDPSDTAATGRLASTWSTAPTVPAILMRRVTLAAAIGAGVIWVPEDGAEWVVASGAYMVFWNHGAALGSILDIYVRWRE